MAVPAKLYADDRAAIRRAVQLDATVRDVESRPVDVAIADLSASGFAMTTDADLAIGAVIGIGLAGVPRRDARIVRRTGTLYGCEFLLPIGDVDIDLALTAETVVPASFGAAAEPAAPIAPARPERLRFNLRIIAVAGASIALWTAIGMGVVAAL